MKTVEEKYKFLLNQLEIRHVDLWDKDALLEMAPMYFQFSKSEEPKLEAKDIDWAVEQVLLEFESRS